MVTKVCIKFNTFLIVLQRERLMNSKSSKYQRNQLKARNFDAGSALSIGVTTS